MASIEELRELGFSAAEVNWRVRQKRLKHLSRRVYRIGPARLTQRGRFRAALLAGGHRAVLFARSAAALHGVRPDGRTTVDVATAKQRRSRDGIVFHTARLDPQDITVVDGFAVTSLARTFVDLGAVVPNHLTRALIRADKQHLTDLFALQDLFERRPLLRGISAVKKALEEHHPLAHRTRSMAELAYLLVITKAGLPTPQVNNQPLDFEVDFHWPNLRLVVEIDGPDHDTAFQRAKDRARDELLEAHGWRVLRFKDTDLRDRPAWVLAQTRRAIARAASIAA